MDSWLNSEYSDLAVTFFLGLHKILSRDVFQALFCPLRDIFQSIINLHAGKQVGIY